jgi:hypothetical protein
VRTGSGLFKAVRAEYGGGKTVVARWVADQAKRLGFAAAEVQIEWYPPVGCQPAWSGVSSAPRFFHAHRCKRSTCKTMRIVFSPRQKANTECLNNT